MKIPDAGANTLRVIILITYTDIFYRSLKGKVSFVFGTTSLVATIIPIFYIPELEGRTYMEIDQLFMDSVPPRSRDSKQLSTRQSLCGTLVIGILHSCVL